MSFVIVCVSLEREREREGNGESVSGVGVGVTSNYIPVLFSVGKVGNVFLYIFFLAFWWTFFCSHVHSYNKLIHSS